MVTLQESSRDSKVRTTLYSVQHHTEVLLSSFRNKYVTIAVNRNLSNCENSPKKSFSELQRDSNPWPSTGSNPVEAPKNFFSGYLRNCLNCDSTGSNPVEAPKNFFSGYSEFPFTHSCAYLTHKNLKGRSLFHASASQGRMEACSFYKLHYNLSA